MAITNDVKFKSTSSINLLGRELFNTNISFSRASNAYEPNQNGFYRSVSNGEPIFRYDPKTGDEDGFAFFQSNTQVLSDPQNYTGSGWSTTNSPTSSQNKTDITGSASSAWTLGDDNGSKFESFSQTATIGDNSKTHSAMFWVGKDSTTSRYPGLRLQFTGGTALDHLTHIDTSNGTLTDENNDGTANIYEGNDFWLVHIMMSNNGTGNTTANVEIFPARGTTQGTSSSSATGTAVFSYTNFFKDNTTPYPLVTSNTTRNADIASFDLSTASGFKQGEGTFFIEGVFNKTSTTDRLFTLHDGSSTNRILLFTGSGDPFQLAMNDGGVSQFSSSTGLVINTGQRYKIACSYDSGGVSLAIDGAVLLTETGTIPSGLTTLHIGSGVAGADPANAHYSRAWLKPQSVSDAQLKNMTI